MSILIKGMEMPTSCWACACYHHKVDDGYYDYDVCQASGTVFNDGYASVTGHKDRIDPFKQRLGNCPLVPVPKHGRLIEDTAVREQIDEWLDSVGDVVVGHGLSYYGELLGCIEDAPTIIPAEEGNE